MRNEDGTLSPPHHWKKCSKCGGVGGVKWIGFREPLCEECLLHMFDQEIMTRRQ